MKLDITYWQALYVAFFLFFPFFPPVNIIFNFCCGCLYVSLLLWWLAGDWLGFFSVLSLIGQVRHASLTRQGSLKRSFRGHRRHRSVSIFIEENPKVLFYLLFLSFPPYQALSSVRNCFQRGLSIYSCFPSLLLWKLLFLRIFFAVSCASEEPLRILISWSIL